jgi:FAD:protein FMN transferase
MLKKRILNKGGVAAAILLITFGGCKNNTQKDYITVDGFAQGSTYHIIYRDEGDTAVPSDSIERYLRDIDYSVSGYNEASLLTKINKGENSPLDSIFTKLFRESEKYYKLSSGKFDISGAPLFDMWGFGFKEGKEVTKKMIDSVKQFIGMDKARIITGKEGKPYLQRDDPRMQFNFNAIAQGYTCDYIAKKLNSKGIDNYLIEIGGEVYCKGVNSKGKKWKVGIDKPIDGNNIPGEEMECAILISGKGLVTSGNYRKFYIKEGKKYSHTIDPISGYPVTHSLLCATVIADNATTADALATYFMVIGLQEAQKYLNANPNLQALLIYEENGKMKTYYTNKLEIINFDNH